MPIYIIIELNSDEDGAYSKDLCDLSYYTDLDLAIQVAKQLNQEYSGRFKFFDIRELSLQNEMPSRFVNKRLDLDYTGVGKHLKELYGAFRF